MPWAAPVTIATLSWNLMSTSLVVGSVRVSPGFEAVAAHPHLNDRGWGSVGASPGFEAVATQPHLNHRWWGSVGASPGFEAVALQPHLNHWWWGAVGASPGFEAVAAQPHHNHRWSISRDHDRWLRCERQRASKPPAAHAGSAIVLVSRYSSNPATPISRPMPDCL